MNFVITHEYQQIFCITQTLFFYSSAVFGENPRYCFSLGVFYVLVFVVLQKLGHFVNSWAVFSLF